MATETKTSAPLTSAATHCPDGTMHLWERLSPGTMANHREIAGEAELKRARVCFKCGAWK